MPCRRRARAAAVCTGLLLSAAGCTPALNWRDLHPAGSGAAWQLPCRATGLTRSVLLAGVPLQLTLHACSADGSTWGFAVADAGDAARVGPALQALRQAAAANLAAPSLQPLPLAVSGAASSAASGRWRIDGRAPDGSTLTMQLALFSHGTRIYQASVLGVLPAGDAAETFFGAIRVGLR